MEEPVAPRDGRLFRIVEACSGVYLSMPIFLN